MTYIDLVGFLINPEILKKLYSEMDVNPQSEVLLIYLKNALELDSEISIFEIEETEDDLVFEKEGVKYYQLFSIDYAIDLIENDLKLKNKGYSTREIAQRLLNYRLNDA